MLGSQYQGGCMRVEENTPKLSYTLSRSVLYISEPSTGDKRPPDSVRRYDRHVAVKLAWRMVSAKPLAAHCASILANTPRRAHVVV
jgi:hypothetical protein